MPTQRFQFSATAFAVIAACVLATGGALVYSGASRAADEPKAGQPRPALTVSTAQPQRTAVPVRLAANGNVAAWQEASIGAESNGLRLTDVRVNVGDVVKAGQVLATFSAETVLADVAGFVYLIARCRRGFFPDRAEAMSQGGNDIERLAQCIF